MPSCNPSPHLQIRCDPCCVLRQEAKRKKPLPPAPAIVGKGSAFTQEVWQNAALLVDKPQGWTSFDVCAKLRGALKTKKVPQLSLNYAYACRLLKMLLQ